MKLSINILVGVEVAASGNWVFTEPVTLRGGCDGLEEILICVAILCKKRRPCGEAWMRRCVRTEAGAGGRQLQGEECQEVPDTTRTQEEAEGHPLKFQKEHTWLMPPHLTSTLCKVSCSLEWPQIQLVTKNYLELSAESSCLYCQC